MVLSAIGGLLGGVAVAAGAAGKGGQRQAKQAVDLWKKLELSDFDFRALDPPELQMLREMMPEVYTAVVPEQFQGVADSPGARESQVRALGQMERIAQEGLPLEDRLAAAEAGRAVTSAASASRLDALRNLAARGQLGAGDELQAGIAGSAISSNLARDLGSDLARQAALRRLSGIEGAGNMAAQLRGSDIDINTRNAEIANRFAELFSRARTQEAADAAGARERAHGYNVRTAQDLGQTNVLNRYQTALENLNRQNQLRQQGFQQRLARTSGQTGALGLLGQFKEAERQSKAQGLVSAGQGAGGIGDSLLGGII